MRRWLLLIAVCVLCACRGDERAPAAPANDAGHGGAPGTGAGGGGSTGTGPNRDGDRETGGGPPNDTTPPGSQLDRPAELPRPPSGRLPEDLKPPVR